MENKILTGTKEDEVIEVNSDDVSILQRGLKEPVVEFSESLEHAIKTDEIVDVEPIEINENPAKQESGKIYKNKEGKYCIILDLAFPLPYQQDFHAAYLLPLIKNCMEKPIIVTKGDKEVEIGHFTSNLAFNLELNSIGLEAQIEEHYINLDFEDYTVSVQIELPDNIADPKATYSSKDLNDILKVEHIQLIHISEIEEQLHKAEQEQMANDPAHFIKDEQTGEYRPLKNGDVIYDATQEGRINE